MKNPVTYNFIGEFTINYDNTDPAFQKRMCDLVYRQLSLIADALRFELDWNDTYAQPEGFCEQHNAYERTDIVTLTRVIRIAENVVRYHKMFYLLAETLSSTKVISISYKHVLK